MKKLFTIAFLSVCFLSAKAQSGSVLVGGEAGLQSNKSENPFGEGKSTSFAISPFVGYQFNDHWTAGAKFRYAHGKSEQTGQQESTISSFQVGPFIRYTKPLSDIFWIYGQAEAGVGKSKNKIEGQTVGTQDHFGIGLFPAVFVNLKNSFGLNLSFGGISYGKTKGEGGFSSSGFAINFGSTANIGISKNFGGKKK